MAKSTESARLERGAALIVGAGDGTGGALARRFAQGGFTACINRRDADRAAQLVERIRAAGDRACACPGDARDEKDVAARVERIEREQGPIEVLVCNVGSNRAASILDQDAGSYRRIWELGCFAGFLNAREVARRMVPRGRGTILFTGATASLRGAAGYVAFAGAKHGLRALAQSMARELGPKGIHVAHVVIDGVIDIAGVKDRFPARYAEWAAQGRLLSPEHIAENFWYLHSQPRDAWTFEMDLRAHVEPW